MMLREITESVTQIWGKKGGKAVRKYRCTSGTRKGRIVAKPSTCTAPKRVSSQVTMKKTRRRKGHSLNVSAQRVKRTNPISRRLKSINRRRKSKR